MGYRFLFTFAMGFSIASMPGPIMALIATETLRRGVRSGSQAAIAPICVDALVMLPLVLILHAAIPSGMVAIAIGVAGGAFLVWLGVQSLRAWRIDSRALTQNDFVTGLPSFTKGVLTHLMSPYPYVFWGTVGLAFVRDGFQTGGIFGALHFPLAFWLGASAFNFLVVFLIVRGKRMLPPTAEPYTQMFAGLLLITAGVFLTVTVAIDQF